MASKAQSILAILVILTVVQSCTGRNIPTSSNNPDMKQPEVFVQHDGSVLIPGIGRFLIPTKHSGFNPFTYNPITGTNDGTGVSIPTIPGVGGTTPSYIPGGDDNPIPNPGFEFPIGGLPSPPARH